ncbi:two pore potassium channel protein sup-9-like [Orbicella faveolata]|uniref:two pore potassium channel protein sup-9-like n=1 Tax=Orbicella faveolata TaxID=48498 RepID=UPI0009E31293|nr:two pore potassium channel protein sup-9-like [Orbicella faveolata]
MDPLIKTAILRTLGFLLWALLSAWLFVIVEYTEKDDRQEKYQLLYSLYQFLASKYNMSLEEFNNISSIAYEALSEPKPQWTYDIAVNFVWQALTTIGYGWITPQTPTGQILCIFVSLLGIPITLLAFKSIGELIAKWVNTIVSKFEKKILKRLEPKHMKTKGAVILFSTMISLIALNSVLLMYHTDWTLVERVYYCFITFTTIGFGDYVVEKPQQRSTKLSLNSSVYQESHESLNEEQTALVELFFTFYTIFALCIVSSVLNAIMAVIEERRCRPRCPGCVPRKTQDTGDNDVPYSDAPKQRETNPTYLCMENYGLQKDSMISLSVTELK